MVFKCDSCQKIVAKEDRRRKVPLLEAVPPASIERQPGTAPAVKCVCGRRTWFIKASR